MKLGDRIKSYEDTDKFDTLPVCVRLDGKAFHSFTKGLERPFDVRLSRLMIETTKYLVTESNARIGYTQSDEITLIFEKETELFMGGRKFKMISILSSLCSLFFNKNLTFYKEKNPIFDCRAFEVPNRQEALNCLIWREIDASKNSVSMLAQNHFSHKQLQGKHKDDMLGMLLAIGVKWEACPHFFKYGTYIQRYKKFIKFSTEELDKLPEKHEARTNPDLLVERSVVRELEISALEVENMLEVVFSGEEPK